VSTLAENPLTEGLERLPAQPTTLTIFGASGDLARRKLLPALYNLARDGSLPERFALVGIARGDMSDNGFRAFAEDAIRLFSRRTPDPDVLRALLEGARFVPGSFDDAQLYDQLACRLGDVDSDAGEPLNRVFYLSTAPEFFPVIVEQLGAHGLNRRAEAEVRIVIEKPFGTTLVEARDLNRRVLSVFAEPQVFRIDHYLGKETVQNLLAFRFANSLFERAWNRDTVQSIQITAAEDLGIEGRAGYYDAAGALRDLVQNHMLQLLCHVAMEPPVDFSADEVRNEKVKVLRAIHPPASEDVARIAVRGQYGPGIVGGEPVRGYLEEPGVPNTLVMTIQPDEGVSLTLAAKIPGTRMRIRPVLMQFLYGTSFMSESPEAYERLILDVLRGDATLFTRNDEVEAQWRICDPILGAWAAAPNPPPLYRAGTQGPDEAASILAPGDAWRML
jgi:glucose-6-phosphate 1-dehydrogenase